MVKVTLNEKIINNEWRTKDDIVSEEDYEILKRCDKHNKNIEILKAEPIDEEIER